MSFPSPRRNAAPHIRHRTPLLVFASYALLVIAWIFANPPHAAPDECHHYIRAVSIGHGQLIGTPAGREGGEAIVGPVRPPLLSASTYETRLAWVAQNTTRVHIPAGLTPSWFRCEGRGPYIPARGLNTSPPLSEASDWYNPIGTYQPLPYLVPAAISRIATGPDSLSRLMRAGKAAVSLALLGAAILLLWDSNARLASLAGVLVAVTPMAVFLSATLNPSGLEIMSALAFTGALLHLTRNAGPNRWSWPILALSGGTLALSRTQGPIWIVLILAIAVLMNGPGPALRATLRRSRGSTTAWIAIVAAILLNRTWEYLYGPRLIFDVTPPASVLHVGLSQLPRVVKEQIGVFDYLEVDMPRLGYIAWAALAAALAVTASIVGTWRDRLVLAIAALAALALPVLLVATTMRHTGFGLQGRYVLPFSIVVPLLAGEIITRQSDRLRRLDVRLLAVPVAACVAVVQLLAWWANGRRFAVGIEGPRWYFGTAEWNPPLGWWPWLALAAGGAALLIAVALAEWRLTASRPNSSTRTA